MKGSYKLEFQDGELRVSSNYHALFDMQYELLDKLISFYQGCNDKNIPGIMWIKGDVNG